MLRNGWRARRVDPLRQPSTAREDDGGEAVVATAEQTVHISGDGAPGREEPARTEGEPAITVVCRGEQRAHRLRIAGMRISARCAVARAPQPVW